MKKWVKASSALSWALQSVASQSGERKVAIEAKSLGQLAKIRWEKIKLKGEELENQIASKKRMVIKAVSDGCTLTEAKREAKVTGTLWEKMCLDYVFLDELEFAIDSDIRLAKSKVRLGLEKDDCEEFALKYLKAKLPNEYGSQSINMTHWVKNKWEENKSVDEMLIQYYQE